MMPRARKFRLEHVPLAVALFVTGCIVFGFVSRSLRQTPRPAPSAACMQELSYSFALPGDRQVLIRAEKMTLTDQRLDDVVFTLFKEVVLSGVEVTVTGGDASGMLDWATFDGLALLAACMITNASQEDGLNLAGTKILLQNVKVYLYPRHGQRRTARMLADSLCLGGMSDEAVFTGRFDLKIKHSKHVCSTTGATWSTLDRVIRFPKGFSLNGRSKHKKVFAFAGGGRRHGKLARTFKRGPGKDLALGRMCPSNGFGSADGGPGQVTFNKKFVKYLLAPKNWHKVSGVFWQFLALNPGALAGLKLSPGQILLPNAKLGAFDPGPFFGSNNN